ncbi:MAG TPA: amidohydrolase [Aeromicrobium sp.]|nr:amidohydrolase [Aeromicrobium sp.]
MDQISTTIEAIAPDLIELRRDLHAHPELAWMEERTTDVVASWMDKLDVAYRRWDGSGLVAQLGPADAPAIALRADLDALPIRERTTVPWRSTVDGVAHACGHDIHTASLVGAAVALVDLERRGLLPVQVRLVFQPAEEAMPGGALKVLSLGEMTGVSRIFALHCDPSLDAGLIGIREGAITGASDRLRVVLTGRGGHTSRPHLTEDVTFAAGTLITQLPAVLSRRFDPRSGVSMVWGHMHAGDAANVIPVHAELAGTVRMLDAGAWHGAEAIVRQTIEDIVRPFGVAVDSTYLRGVPPVVNDFAATEALRSAVESAVGRDGVTTTPQSLGGEDFGWYLETVPGAMGRLGTRTPGGPTHDLHQGTFEADERAVAVGAAVLAHAALAPL